MMAATIRPLDSPQLNSLHPVATTGTRIFSLGPWSTSKTLPCPLTTSISGLKRSGVCHGREYWGRADGFSRCHSGLYRITGGCAHLAMINAFNDGCSV
jgi:hypothetical protein